MPRRRHGYLNEVTASVLVEEFPPDARSVAGARRFLRQALHEIGQDDTGRELADLLVTAANELATNAVLHARTDYTIRVLLDPAVARIEVTDENPRTPQPCLAPIDATSGRGLAIIDGSGLQWGVDRHAGGKTVWIQAIRKAPADR